MDSNKLNAEDSLCWTCTYGICVQESEQEHLVHMDRNPLDEEAIDDAFGMGDAFSDVPSGDRGPIEHTIEHARIKTVCSWRPENIPEFPAIIVCNVTQCNRFKKES